MRPRVHTREKHCVISDSTKPDRNKVAAQSSAQAPDDRFYMLYRGREPGATVPLLQETPDACRVALVESQAMRRMAGTHTVASRRSCSCAVHNP